MKKHLFTILIGATSMVASSPVRAQSIVATHDAYGHTVWVAGDEAKPQPKPQTQETSGASGTVTQPVSNPEEPSRYSGLVYWSNKEHRWKAVPLASSATMKAARRAAQEVNDMVGPISKSDSRALMLSRPVNLKSDSLTEV